MNLLLSVIVSTAAIAAYSVRRQADSLLNPITLGMAETVAIIAGVLVGEENRFRLKKLLLTSVWATAIVTVGAAVLIYVFAPQFSALFIKDNPEALSLSVTAVRCYAIGMPIYGFSHDDKEHSIDVRVVKNGDDYTLRFHDDCPIFDPVKQLELYSDEEPVRHIGLRMISGIAKDMQYNSFLKLNILVIKV